MSEPLTKTERTRLRRAPTRGSHDRAAIHAILDAAPLAHVAAADGDLPVVRPMTHWRIGDFLYLHTAKVGQLAKLACDGKTLCVSVAIVDGMVLARSAFAHSVNYRSVTLFAAATEVTDPAEKEKVLDALVDKVVPGRSGLLRPMTTKERDATLVLKMPIDEASAKSRLGPPRDAETDRDWPVWAGVIPLALMPLPPVQDSSQPTRLEAPALGPWAGSPPPSGQD